MRDIGDKEITRRTAIAGGKIKLKPHTVKMIRGGEVKKGNVLECAKVAGINAVKSTPALIPFCHPIPITSAGIMFELGREHVGCQCRVDAEYRTGVEMEALVGVTIALLTVWDMVKYLEKDERGQYPWARLKSVKVLEKKK